MRVKVKVDGDSQNHLIKALNKFTKKVKQAGIIQEIYDRREYVKPSRKKKLKREEAYRRSIREQRKEQNRKKYIDN